MAGASPSPHETLCSYDTPKLLSVRHRQWKYDRWHRTDNAGYWPLKQGPVLFDLDRDPNESYRLVESEPGGAAELAAMLDAWEAQMAADLRGWRD